MTNVRYFTISNLLSVCRIPLAFCFLPQIAWLRFVVVVLAGLTDYLDGFLARRLKTTSQVGALLDPLMDKFFMFFVIAVLYAETQMGGWEALAMVSRDIFLLALALCLFATGVWRTIRFRSALWGKVITLLQYVTLLLVIVGWTIPPMAFIAYPVMGLLYFGELFIYSKRV